MIRGCSNSLFSWVKFMEYRTYLLDIQKGWIGRGTHNIKRTIKLLDKLIYEDQYEGNILIVIEDTQDIPIILNNVEEYENFRRDHYENQIRDTSTKYKSLHR